MTEDDITPEHSHARVEQVLEDIDALRLEMGRSRDARVAMHVRAASPREVYYHAQTVYRKADQLCLELGGEAGSPPRAVQPWRARPADVLALLEGTRERLARARSLLALEGDTAAPALPGALGRTPGKEASDVLAGCLLASRQLNAMLARSFGARESHEQLARALALAAELLAVHGAALPPAPPFEPRKFPRDVYRELWHAYGLLHRMLSGSGVASPEIQHGYVGEEPTDVYDLAALIVSELEYLRSLLPQAEGAAPPAPAPGPIVPAHNFRLARQLHAALERLAEAGRARPGWLRQPLTR